MKRMGTFMAGLLIGTTLFGGSVAYAAGIMAERSTHTILVDGVETPMTAYAINGNNYVMLRDIGAAVDFNVFWDTEKHCVQVESDKPYTGQPSLPSTDLDAVRSEMVERINDVRMQHGAQFLRIDDRLMAAAQECADKHYTWHHDLEECEAVARSGYPYGFGINLTVFTLCPTDHVAEQAVENWVNSPGHFRTMTVSDGDSIGVGVARENGVTYCYMIVGRPGTYNPYGA